MNIKKDRQKFRAATLSIASILFPLHILEMFKDCSWFQFVETIFVFLSNFFFKNFAHKKKRATVSRYEEVVSFINFN